MKSYINIFEQIISLENLFGAWGAFSKGKRHKPDVQRFEFQLEQNIFRLHRELKSKKYKHGLYKGFYMRDPKVRHIHRATVRDRVLHHAVYAVLNPIFEPRFIDNSFSCRVGKGTHAGVYALHNAVRKISKNGTQPCFALKCDIRKYFDSIDHGILMRLLTKRIHDDDTVWLIREIVESFSHESDSGKGLPIGNLTSQLFANVYLTELDYFMKHNLRIQYYLRYTDDFIILSNNKHEFVSNTSVISDFLKTHLELKLHPDKISIRKLRQGIDFLGYVVFLKHILLRTKTKRRMFRRVRAIAQATSEGDISESRLESTITSYLGVLSHANTERLREGLLNFYWFERTV